MDRQSPPLLRPIPRRPFNVNLASPTPPDDDHSPACATPDVSATTPQLLNPQRASDAEGLPRSQSILNLTSSTLFGIFSPSTPNRDQFYGDTNEADTPWGTGAQSPVDNGRRRDLDEATCALLRERSEALVRRSTGTRSHGGAPSPSRGELALALGLRTGLLFLLGMGYGALVTRLRVENPFSNGDRDRERPGVGAAPEHNWVYLATWGVSGVALGALLPWFDGVWQAAFGPEAEAEPKTGDVVRNVEEKELTGSGNPKPGTDWNHVVRSIGAFVGIVFALRRLPWVSTLQVSLALALVNPFLWYLVDRTKPGFLLSAAVGVAGSLVLMVISPNMMPAPSTLSPPWNATIGASAGGGGEHLAPPVSGILAHKETIETGIWVLSVLFCSCVCFGNVGRRLALSKSAAAGSQ